MIQSSSPASSPMSLFAGRFCLLFASAVIGCSSGGGAPPPAAGTGGTTAATGGSGSGGGVSASGGARASGGANGSGGTVGSGGVTGGGGATASGGRAATGGGGGGTGGAATGSGGMTAASICPPGPFPAPVLTGLTPTRIEAVPPSDDFNNLRRNFIIIEGPVWVGDALYLSEFGSATSPPVSRILKVTSSGAVSIALTDSGTNGMMVDGAGNLLAGNHKDGAITRFSLPALTPTAVVSSYGGQRFDSPNDLTQRADGNLYFTDPDHQAPSPRPQLKTRVYRLAPGTTVPTVVDENRNQPNGVTLSPDGSTLYLTALDGLYRYPVAADGSVGMATKIVPSIGGGDGMAIDCGGNLYVSTNNTLVVVSPAGQMLGTITVPGIQATTNAAFGGADHKTLYITALGSGTQSGLFSVAMNLPGYPY